MTKHNLLDQLEERIRFCEKCPFDSKKAARYCGGRGNDYRVMFIGESPSPLKRRGIFSRNDGFKGERKIDLFNNIRKDYGLDDAYITDLVKCGVTKIKPTKDNLYNCKEYLEREICIVNPRVIVLIGKGISFRDGELLCKGSFRTLFLNMFNLNIPIVEIDHYSYMFRFKGNNSKAMDEYRNKFKDIMDRL